MNLYNVKRALAGWIRKAAVGLMALLCVSSVASASDFNIKRGARLLVEFHGASAPVLDSAFELFASDADKVLEASVEKVTHGGDVVIGSIDSLRGSVDGIEALLDSLEGRKEAFALKVAADGRLVIAGSDPHGAAYGLMEMSRLMGVSPWEWWADARPDSLAMFTLPDGYCDLQSPSVEYRGIFINDEDWGLMPWSSRVYEPENGDGVIGPKTYSRIFELLLRLRANTCWPAMHECVLPFFLTEGNREVAKKYGIYIGGSHCEPMACNAAGEWARRGVGEYDYVNNRDEVYRFWEDRVKEVSSQEILYTLGMRGVHDGAMKGAKKVQDRKNVLERVISEQRDMLSRYVNKDITSIPQVFIPYKEVLDIYNAGLDVPDDVTLMWCDDNYGYIRHFPSDAERSRKGGNGIYYHVSYWGRPHDYLWLGSFSPYLLFHQMSAAYDRGVDKMWILNVGDIKPSEYQIELFMDMAWNMDQVRANGVENHLLGFLSREFGEKAAASLLPVMIEYHRLSYIKKPEFLANTRVEESRREYYSTMREDCWSIDSLLTRRAEYANLSDSVESVAACIPPRLSDCYFQLVKYPVQAAAQMNFKFIDAQLAGEGLVPEGRSDAAYDSIAALTAIYNSGINNGEKWSGIMDMAPRRLPVFNRVSYETHLPRSQRMTKPLAVFDGVSGDGAVSACPGLGYNGGAVDIARNDTVLFSLPAFNGCDSLLVDVRLLPTHPMDDGDLRFSLMLDGSPLVENVVYSTRGRSEEWKCNVLRNQAVRSFAVRNDGLPHRLGFVPITDGVTLDRILLWGN